MHSHCRRKIKFASSIDVASCVAVGKSRRFSLAGKFCESALNDSDQSTLEAKLKKKRHYSTHITNQHSVS